MSLCEATDQVCERLDGDRCCRGLGAKFEGGAGQEARRGCSQVCTATRHAWLDRALSLALSLFPMPAADFQLRHGYGMSRNLLCLRGGFLSTIESPQREETLRRVDRYVDRKPFDSLNRTRRSLFLQPFQLYFLLILTIIIIM